MSDAGQQTILRRIRSYLQVHRRATLGDFALHFHVAPEAMRGMLDTWLRKGTVRELSVQASCNLSCPVSCDDTSMTIYEWVGRGSASDRLTLPVIQPNAPVGGGGCHPVIAASCLMISPSN